jgi:hypothetical protein
VLNTLLLLAVVVEALTEAVVAVLVAILPVLYQ